MLPFEIPVIAFLPQLDFDPKTEEYYIPEYMMKRNSLYLNKISKEGGSILNLDFQSDLDSIKDVDGWLIPGGADIDPSLYNEQKRTETVCHKLGRDRANLERKIFEKMPLQVPILGICYGTQIINVLKGFFYFLNIVFF